MTMATAAAMTTMAAATISIRTGRSHHHWRDSKQAPPEELHCSSALSRQQQKEQQQQRRRQGMVGSGPSAALSRWVGSCIVVVVLLFVVALGCQMPTAFCASRGWRGDVPDDDQDWITQDHVDSPADPEKIIRYIELTDGRGNARTTLLGNCIPEFQRGSFRPLNCESITFKNIHVFYPSFQSDQNATLVTGAEAIKESFNLGAGVCSKNRFVAAAYWKSIHKNGDANNPVTRLLFTISAMLAFRPRMVIFSSFLETFREVTQTMFGNLFSSLEEGESIGDVLRPYAATLWTYGDFIALELSQKSPKVARALLDVVMREEARTRQPVQRRAPNPEQAAARQERRMRNEAMREAMRQKWSLKKEDNGEKVEESQRHPVTLRQSLHRAMNTLGEMTGDQVEDMRREGEVVPGMVTRGGGLQQLGGSAGDLAASAGQFHERAKKLEKKQRGGFLAWLTGQT